MNSTTDINGRVTFFGTIILGMVNWFSPENIDMSLKIFTGLGAIVSAILASRYYYYAAKEKKRILDDRDEQDRIKNAK